MKIAIPQYPISWRYQRLSGSCHRNSSANWCSVCQFQVLAKVRRMENTTISSPAERVYAAAIAIMVPLFLAILGLSGT